MIKKISLILLTIVALIGCSNKPPATELKLDLGVIIVKEHKDNLGRLITWPLGADIEKDAPTLLYSIKDFNYVEGYRYTVPVKIQIEDNEVIYSYFEWGGYTLKKEKTK